MTRTSTRNTGPDPDGFVRLPVFQRKRVTDRYQELMDYWDKYKGSRIAEDLQRRVAREVAQQLKLDSAEGYAVFLSLDDVFKAKRLDRETLKIASWRLAANREELNRGRAVPADPHHVAPYWAAGEVRDAVMAPVPSDLRKLALTVKFRVNVGRLAGKVLTETYRPYMGSNLFRRLAGDKARVRSQNPRLLVGMQCALEVEFHEGELSAKTIAVTKSQQAANVSRARSRFRRYNPCPYMSPNDCDMCPVGPNECRLSLQTNPTNLLRKTDESRPATDGGGAKQ